jgi:hypothetical protein
MTTFNLILHQSFASYFFTLEKKIKPGSEHVIINEFEFRAGSPVCEGYINLGQISLGTDKEQARMPVPPSFSIEILSEKLIRSLPP